MKPLLCVSAAFATAAAAALAAAPVFAIDGPGLPAVQQQGPVAFMTGGMRETQAQAMEARADTYPLTLQFVRRYPSAEEALDGVHVSIRDATGKPVLNVADAGPLMMAKLPAGRYLVEAVLVNDVKVQSIALDGRHPDRIVFAWKQ